MTQSLKKAVTDWCKLNLTDDVVNNLDSGEESPLALYKDFASHGWVEFADVYGDQDNLKNMMEVAKITASYSSVICNMVGVSSACSLILTSFGDDRQKEIGRKIMQGKALASFSLTEPEAGSDIQNLKTTASFEDGQWVLNGEKYFATGAANADYILIVARTNLEESLNRGISLFLVPKDAKGVEIVPQEKIATNGFPSCEIALNSLVVEPHNLVGGQDRGWGVIAFAGAVERLMVAASCVGLSRIIWQFLYEFTQKRIIGGSPLYEIQWVNHELASMAIKIQAADLLIDNAINLLIAGRNPAIEICGAKVFASEMQQEIAMSAMKIVGGRSYLKEYPLERWQREGLLSLFAGGTNELQKNLIARKLPGVLG